MWSRVAATLGSAKNVFEETFKEEEGTTNHEEARFVIDDDPEAVFPQRSGGGGAHQHQQTSTSLLPPVRALSDDTVPPPPGRFGGFGAVMDPNALLNGAATRAKMVASSATSVASSVGSKARDAIGRSGIPVVSAAIAAPPPPPTGGGMSNFVKVKRASIAVCVCVVLLIVGPPVMNLVHSTARAVRAISGNDSGAGVGGGTSTHHPHHPHPIGPPHHSYAQDHAQLVAAAAEEEDEQQQQQLTPHLHYGAETCGVQAAPGQRDALLGALRSILAALPGSSADWRLLEDVGGATGSNGMFFLQPTHTLSSLLGSARQWEALAAYTVDKPRPCEWFSVGEEADAVSVVSAFVGGEVSAAVGGEGAAVVVPGEGVVSAGEAVVVVGEGEVAHSSVWGSSNGSRRGHNSMIMTHHDGGKLSKHSSSLSRLPESQSDLGQEQEQEDSVETKIPEEQQQGQARRSISSSSE